MRLPTIHLNGTDAQSLFDGYKAAYEAVRDAQRALAQCAPNGRDYYPQEGNATSEAMAEHRARMAALDTIEREMAILAMHVHDVGGDKVRS